MADPLSVWAIIPARGGSKSIPRKNLEKIAGVSLVARAIRTCRSAAAIDLTVVSTDSEEIAAEATSEQAVAVMRPTEISGDMAASEDALIHALELLRTDGRCLPDMIVFVQCTSPFISPDDIDGVIETLVRTSADCAFTAARHHGFLWRQTDSGIASGVNHDSRTRLRRQERADEFLETGAVYAMRVAGFLANRHRFFGRIAIHEVARTHAVEIDEPADLAIARLLASACDTSDRFDSPQK